MTFKHDFNQQFLGLLAVCSLVLPIQVIIFLWAWFEDGVGTALLALGYVLAAVLVACSSGAILVASLRWLFRHYGWKSDFI